VKIFPDMSQNSDIKFLLVDDLESNLIALEAILRRDGLTLLKARSGKEALELLLVHEIALAFVDVQMPEMTGFELAEIMRGTELTKSVPIIFLTAGIVDQQRRIQGYETGAVDFLLKPIDPAILLNKAGIFFDLARQRQDLEESQFRLQELNERLATTNARLETEDRAKDEFLAMLAHELRNPIAPILTGVDILQRSPGDAALVEKVTGMMKRQTDQMARLIDDLLDISRITTGKIGLRMEEISVAEVVDAAVESVHPLIARMEHRFSFVNAPTGWRIAADTHRLAQVVANLLSNAAKYTPCGGEIRMHVCDKDGMLMISVKDNGKGIKPDHQAGIFDLFDQGAEGAKDGLGIGLTLVKTLVDMHGGDVSLISEGEGMGSEFTVILPGLVKGGAVDNDILKGEGEDSSPKKLKVLIADDGKATADILNMFFVMEGMETAVAYDGAQAIKEAETFAPDLVCLDLGMPVVDGYEAARKIRCIQPGAWIVALSGWGSEEDRKRTAEAGFDEHLTKPVNPGDLRALMKRRF
jgi:signal transduction histidine kinase